MSLPKPLPKMAKKRDRPNEEPRAVVPEVLTKAVPSLRYRIRGGALVVKHPYGITATKDHLEGPHAETFIRAFKHLDEKDGTEWYTKHIEELK